MRLSSRQPQYSTPWGWMHWCYLELNLNAIKPPHERGFKNPPQTKKKEKALTPPIHTSRKKKESKPHPTPTFFFSKVEKGLPSMVEIVHSSTRLLSSLNSSMTQLNQKFRISMFLNGFWVLLWGLIPLSK